MTKNEYKLLCGTQGELNDAVNEHLKDGWEPYGSPTVTTYTTKKTGYNSQLWFNYSQAMVRGATAWQVQK